MNILVTGSAGFIGYHLCLRLLKSKFNKIYGLDSLNDYYDVNLKKQRNNNLKKYKNFFFKKINIANKKILFDSFKNIKIHIVINLAAQAGVRYSISHPEKYLESNILGFFNILEFSKNKKIEHLLYASSSSVYGQNTKFPILEEFETSEPISIYAASKKSNEVMAHSYAYTYNLRSTGLRFFSVYGPYGRPDMALFKFVKNIDNDKFITVYNNGNHDRDFTYVEDVAICIEKLINKHPKTKIPHNIFNIGYGESIKLKNFISMIEKILSKKAKIKNIPLQKGDVQKTHSSNNKIIKKIRYKPTTNVKEGVEKFIIWYKQYYKLWKTKK
jgi:UDP-glucuronate 4-epimerase